MVVDAGGGDPEGHPEGEPGEARTIRLVLPADHAWGRVARTAVAGLALRLGFSYPQIEDLRLAIDEALILLLHPRGGAGSDPEADGRVEVRMQPDDTTLVIDITTSEERDEGPGDTDALTAARDRFAQLVGPTVDDWEVGRNGCRVHLVKRRNG